MQRRFRWLCRAYDNLDEEDRWEPAAELVVLYQDGLGTAQDARWHSAFCRR